MSQGTTSRLGVRDVLAGVPRSGRLLLLGVAVDALGTGLTLPFLVVYFREVRHIALPTVGLLMALPPFVALVLLGPIGLAIDRFGARRLQMVALTFSLLGQFALIAVRGPVTAALALMLGGIGHATFFPAIGALVATAIPSEHRQRFYGLSFTLLNAGIGIGGVVSGLFVDVHRPWTFEVIYLCDGLSYLIPLVLLAFVIRGVGMPVRVHDDDESAHVPASYALVLRDKAFRRFLAVTFVGAFIGYAQLEAGWTAFARIVGGISTTGIGVAFAANTAVIVLLQLPVVRRIEGHRRTRLLMLMAVIWAVAWAIVGLAGLVGGAVAFALLVASAAIFGAGETLNSPVVPAVVNDLSSDHLRGRYNAVNSVAFQIAAVLGPISAGLLIGHGLSAAYIVMLLAGSGVLIVLLLTLETRISPAANGIRPAAQAADGSVDST
jgi:MFS family permease